VLSVKRDGEWMVVDAQNTNYEIKYINDYRGSGNEPNVKYRRDGVVVAVENIKSGVELLVDYGNEFWLDKK